MTGQRGCAECHGADGKGRFFIDSPNGLYVKSPNITPGAGEVVAGGKIPGGPPDWPPAEKTVMGPYDTAQKFVAMMRTGKRPDGSDVSPVMPLASLKMLTDVDLQAVYAFLKTVPAKPAGNR